MILGQSEKYLPACLTPIGNCNVICSLSEQHYDFEDLKLLVTGYTAPDSVLVLIGHALKAIASHHSLSGFP